MTNDPFRRSEETPKQKPLYFITGCRDRATRNEVEHSPEIHGKKTEIN